MPERAEYERQWSEATRVMDDSKAVLGKPAKT